jgi:hypothetical protein
MAMAMDALYAVAGCAAIFDGRVVAVCTHRPKSGFGKTNTKEARLRRVQSNLIRESEHHPARGRPQPQPQPLNPRWG